MEETITVEELINQLKKFDLDKPVNISGVGFSSGDSWNAPLMFGKESVDEFKGVVRIHISTVG